MVEYEIDWDAVESASMATFDNSIAWETAKRRAAAIERACEQAVIRGEGWRVAASDPVLEGFRINTTIQILPPGKTPDGRGPWTIYGPWGAAR